MRRMRFLGIVAVCLAALAGSAAAGQPVKPLSSHAKAPLATRDISNLPEVPGCTVDPDRELFVIDLSAMRDCYRTTWTGPCPTPVGEELLRDRGGATGQFRALRAGELGGRVLDYSIAIGPIGWTRTGTPLTREGI